jgi:FkbM family methyltransferase
MHPLLVALKRRYNKQRPPKPFAYLFRQFRIIPKGVFQVGANSGGEIKEFVAQGIKSGIFVEPLPDVYKKLEKTVSYHPGFFSVNSVCTDVAGETCSFYVSTSGSMGASSSILKPTGVLTLYPEVPFDSQPITLKSTTVDQIVADFKADGRANIIKDLDLLYMDTQGSELTVLKGASEFLKQVRYIFTEVSLGGLYENDVTHIELTGYLASHGFSLAFIYMNKQGWGDALYVHNSLFDK